MPKKAHTSSDYRVRDLARDLRNGFPGQVKTMDLAQDLAYAMVLNVMHALVKGRRVVLGDYGHLELLLGKQTHKVTPQGEPWAGKTRPRLRAVAFQALVEEVDQGKSREAEESDV